MRRLIHSIETTLVRSLGALTRLLPRRAALEVGAAVGQLGWWLRVRRSVVMSHLRLAFPEMPEAQRVALGAAAARNIGRTIVEFLRFAGKDQRHVGELIELSGLDELRGALSAGRGVVVVTGHYGAWGLYVTALATAGIPAALLVGRQSNPGVHDIVLGLSAGVVRMIPKGKTAPRGVLEALRAGHCTVMVADHYNSSEKLIVPFLGHPASTLPLPGALVVRHGLPLFVMEGHRRADGTHLVALRQLRAGGDDPDATEESVGREINDALSDFIRRYPEQYFWYHRRWKLRGHRQRDERPPAPQPSAP